MGTEPNLTLEQWPKGTVAMAGSMPKPWKPTYLLFAIILLNQIQPKCECFASRSMN